MRKVKLILKLVYVSKWRFYYDAPYKKKKFERFYKTICYKRLDIISGLLKKARNGARIQYKEYLMRCNQRKLHKKEHIRVYYLCTERKHYEER